MVEKHLATGWTFRQKSGGEWRQARVPGHVHDDLVRHGVIQDPFYRMNERDCQWVDQEDWVYRCRFEWAPAVGMPRKVLRFEGLDTVATVFLNGEKIAESDNMFLPFEVDVAETLRVGENELVIEFQSAVRVAEERKARYLAQEGIDPSVFTFYDRSFVRKAQYMFGWDWGPRLVSCGIWKPIVLMEYDSRITDVWARPRKVGDKKWEVDVSWEGERISQPKFESSDHNLHFEQSNDYLGVICVTDPQLWWPSDFHELGRKVYSGILTCRNSRERFSFGLRTVELIQDQDQWGRSFEFAINDKKVFCKGFNWIPSHSFPSVARPEFDTRGNSIATYSFSNMIRVWGGGLYESDTFFEMMNREGIMVWQDFPFACAYYPEDDATLSSIEKEARANIRRLRNHPSLVLWCGNNENQQMHEQKWGGDKSPERFYGETIYDELLPRILKEEDPDRPYVHGSPSGKIEGKDSNMDGVGDSHYWDVWHGRGDWKHYEDSKSRFCSEFGFASSPSLYTWSKTIDKQDWQFDSEAVKWHDKTLKGYEKYISFIELHYPMIETLEDLVYYSQLNQRDALRHGLEHYLRSEFCRGVLVWQANDCWPVQSWSLMDSNKRAKASFSEFCRLNQPVVASIRVSNGHYEFWITNNSNKPTAFDKLDAAGVYRFDGTPVDAINLMEVPPIRPGKSELISTILVDDNPGKAFAMIVLRQFPCLRFAVEPKDFAPPLERLRIQVASDDLVVYPSSTCLFDLWIYDPDDPSNVRPVICDITPFIPPMCSPINIGTFTSRLDHEPKRLVARSLAGYHEVEITRSPL